MPFANDIRHHVYQPIDFLTLDEINSKSASASRTKPNPEILDSNRPHLLNTRLVSAEVAMDAIDTFIDSLTLEDDDVEYMPKYVYNPSYQSMFQCISDRALNPSCPINISEKITDMLKPLPDFEERSGDALEELEKCFHLKLGTID